jgi:DNA-binding MarR family transcriptional regulator
MSLERDIHQKAFRTEYQKGILNILYTHNHLMGKMSDIFKQFDTTLQQYNVLRILRGQYPQPASINVIKERMVEKMSDTSRIVERLRVKGLIDRSHGKVDKRSVEITITEKGLELLEKMQGPVDQMDSILSNLSENEVRELNRLLEKIRTSAPAEIESDSSLLEAVNQPEKF